MAGAFTAVDLSQVPFPGAVETIDYEEILASMVADLQARDPEFSALVESDPAYKILEVCAYREMLVRQRVNEGAKSVMLAYSTGSDLDNLAANYNVERFMIDAGNNNVIPPIPPTYEDDASLRRRVQLSFEGFSTAGPEGAYIFHALGADGQVLDASVISPAPGEVEVYILANTETGAADNALIQTVDNVLNDDEVRPLTDFVRVLPAEIIDYSVDAEIKVFDGPDSDLIYQISVASLNEYVTQSRKLGRDVTRSGIYAALHANGVQNVVIHSPVDDVVCETHQAAHCTSINIVNGGVGE